MVLKKSSPPKVKKTDALGRLSIRFPDEALLAADEVIAKIGLGDRSTIIRKAALYGIRAFLEDPRRIQEAAKISF